MRLILSTLNYILDELNLVKQAFGDSFRNSVKINFAGNLNKFKSPMQKLDIVDPVTSEEVGLFKLPFLSFALRQTDLTLLLLIALAFYHRVLQSVILILMGHAVDG